MGSQPLGILVVGIVELPGARGPEREPRCRRRGGDESLNNREQELEREILEGRDRWRWWLCEWQGRRLRWPG